MVLKTAPELALRIVSEDDLLNEANPVPSTAPSTRAPRRGARLRLLAEGHPRGVLAPRRRGAQRAHRRRARRSWARAPSSSATTTSARTSSSSPTSAATPSSSRAGPPSSADAEFIVFCGVHFMAESAAILSRPHQKVILPNMAAGCSMADMADPEDVYACWDELDRGRRSPASSRSPT